MAISDYYKSIPTKSERARFREEVLSKTGISFPSFYTKMRMNSWNKAEIFVIEHIMKEWEEKCLSE